MPLESAPRKRCERNRRSINATGPGGPRRGEGRMRSRAAAALVCASFLTLTAGSSPALAKTAANEPVQASALAHPAGPTNSVLYVVPAGKRLVVEHFSSEVGVAADTTVNRFSLGVAPN